MFISSCFTSFFFAAQAALLRTLWHQCQKAFRHEENFARRPEVKSRGVDLWLERWVSAVNLRRGRQRDMTRCRIFASIKTLLCKVWGACTQDTTPWIVFAERKEPFLLHMRAVTISPHTLHAPDIEHMFQRLCPWKWSIQFLYNVKIQKWNMCLLPETQRSFQSTLCQAHALVFFSFSHARGLSCSFDRIRGLSYRLWLDLLNLKCFEGNCAATFARRRKNNKVSGQALTERTRSDFSASWVTFLRSGVKTSAQGIVNANENSLTRTNLQSTWARRSDETCLPKNWSEDF